MKKEQRYVSPDIDLLPMSYVDMLCESDSATTEDYELISDFSW